MEKKVLFLSPKDLFKIPGLVGSKSAAYRKYMEIKDFFQKSKHQKIALKDLSTYLDMEETDLYTYLK